MGTGIHWARRLAAVLLIGALAVSVISRAAPARAMPGLAPEAVRSPAASLVHKVYVFGKDDRVELPEKYDHLNYKIGFLHSSKFKYGCTAACVASDVILTAAHCVLRGERNKRFTETEGLRFFLRQPSSKKHLVAMQILYTSDFTPRNVVSEYPVTTPFKRRNFHRDWALVKLPIKFCRNGVLPIKIHTPGEILEASKAGKLMEVAFHGDRSFGKKLLFTDKCAIKGVKASKATAKKKRSAEETERLALKRPSILHTCDMTQGASGSPLLIETETGMSIVGINVAEAAQQRVLKQGNRIVKYFKRQAIYNKALNAALFFRYLAPMRSAKLLNHKWQIASVQKSLTRLKLYKGSADGVFGPSTWSAIRLYEKQQKQRVLGLPTAALRRKLLPRKVFEFEPAEPDSAVLTTGAVSPAPANE